MLYFNLLAPCCLGLSRLSYIFCISSGFLMLVSLISQSKHNILARPGLHLASYAIA